MRLTTAGIGVSVLAACQPGAPPQPTQAPPPAAKAVPTAAPAAPAAPTAQPKAQPTTAPAATAAPAPKAAPAAVGAGKTLTVALASNLSSLDIQDVQTFSDGLAMGLHVYDRLFEQSPSGLKPGLAERWETSQDGRTWTFAIRTGVTFHDGTPLNAQAIKATFDRVMDPNLKLRQASKFQGITSVEAPDDVTLKITTEKPLGALPGNLTHQSGGSVQHAPSAQANTFAIGTGPFKFVEYVPDERIVLERNGDYWGDPPGVERLVYRIVPEARTRLSMLQAGEVQVVYNVAPNEIPGLSADPKFKLETPPSAGWRIYGFNNQKKPFDDVRVRRALNLAVDRETIVRDILKGSGHVADSPLGPGMFGYAPTMKYPYDPEKAKELLKEAGVADGFKTTMIISPSEVVAATEVATAVQAYLQQVGVQAEINSLEQAVWLAELTKPAAENKTEIFQYQYGGADPDALRLVLHPAEWPPRRNGAFYKNERVDKLLEDGAATVDQAKRAEIYKEVQRLVMDDAPWLFVADWAHTDAWLASVGNVTYLLQDIGLIDLRKATVA
jgi:peptide/nickel transport system substrate-binding protein